MEQHQEQKRIQDQLQSEMQKHLASLILKNGENTKLSIKLSNLEGMLNQLRSDKSLLQRECESLREN